MISKVSYSPDSSRPATAMKENDAIAPVIHSAALAMTFIPDR